MMNRRIYWSLTLLSVAAAALVVFAKLFPAQARAAVVAAQAMAVPASIPESVPLTQDLTVTYKIRAVTRDSYPNVVPNGETTISTRPNGDVATSLTYSNGTVISKFHKVGSNRLVVYDTVSRAATSVIEREPPVKRSNRNLCVSGKCFADGGEILGHKTVKSILVFPTMVSTYWVAPDLDYAILKSATSIDGNLVAEHTAVHISRDAIPNSLFDVTGYRMLASVRSFEDATYAARGQPIPAELLACRAAKDRERAELDAQ